VDWYRIKRVKKKNQWTECHWYERKTRKRLI
jgi:uncharacterized protein YodC (DUF2158 family)